MPKPAFDDEEEDDTYLRGGAVAAKELLALRVGLVLCFAVALSASIAVMGGRACRASVYDPTAVPWAELGSDLDAFVASCNCAPILVRLSWHDSGTFKKEDSSGGSRGAQRFVEGEATHGANNGLSVARGLLQPYKEKYPSVSYADLWAFAATRAIKVAGGPQVRFRAGRTDIVSAASCVEEGRLPDGALGAPHIRSVFHRMGFDDAEIVALSGGHTLGGCHADRSSWAGPWTDTPLRFDNRYFELLLECEWTQRTSAKGAPVWLCEQYPDLMMLPTDHALVTDAALRPHTERFASEGAAFATEFAAAFQKLQENGHPDLVDVL